MTDDNKSAAEEVKNEVTEEETAEEVVDETETMEDDDDNNDDEEMEDDDDDDDDEDEEDEDDEDDNQRSGGGKSDYRDSRTRGKRYTPYPRNNRAVYHQADDSDRSCRVYVGNLAWEVTWKELKDHMQVSGCEIARADVLASPDGRSKGCGIVEFESEEGAQRAILTLNDSDLMGRQIFVREDRESGSGGGYYTQQPGNGNGGGGGDDGRQGGGEKQDCRVYVGNLSWDVSWQDLKDHMRTVGGEVSYAEVMKGPDGRSKGCGVVEFSSADEAQEAITQLNDSELSGRMIFVREDRETGGARGGGGAGGGGHRGGSSASVYVGNLAYETSWQDLKDHMRQAGNVDQAHVLQSEDGRSKGCGIVTYQNPRDAVRAIRELQNSDLHGRPINVREDREQGSGRGGGGRGRGGRGFGGRGRGGRGGGRGYNDGGGGGNAGCQLFVNNLSYDTTWGDLKDHFAQCGDVERADVVEGHDGRKKGFGTVRFSNASDATKAIETLNGSDLDGRDIEVRHDNKAY